MANVECTWCVEILPDELLLKILSCNALTIQDLGRIGRTCWRLKGVVETQKLWRIKLKYQWPKVWEEMNNTSSINNWRDETQQLVCFQREVRKMVRGLSPRLFHTSHLTTPVYHEVDAMAASTQRAPLYIISALRQILEEGPEYKNLTEKHYALKVMSHVHQDLCREEWVGFMAYPPSEQALEVGAMLIARWFQPYDHVTIKKMVGDIDTMASECLSKLSTQHPDHPALFKSLIAPSSVLKESRWPLERCRQLFKCINHILFTQMKLLGNSEDYYNLKNSLINEVLLSKRGIPITLSIVYMAVCHRLGILLEPVNYPTHFVMAWKVPGVEEFEYIDAFNKGRRLSRKELTHELPMGAVPDHALLEPCPPLQVFKRMIRNIMNVAQMQAHNSDHMELFCPATELLSILTPQDRDVQELLLRIYYTLEIHYDRIVAGCEALLAESHSPILEEMLHDSQFILQRQALEAPAVPIVPSAARSPEITFAVGLVMQHRRYNYTCVIFGWDKECKRSGDWVTRMGVDNLQYKTMQPFYKVLVADGSHRYAAQENLDVSSEPRPVSHPDVGKYFKEFTGTHYLPNDELMQLFPEDEPVRYDTLRVRGML